MGNQTVGRLRGFPEPYRWSPSKEGIRLSTERYIRSCLTHKLPVEFVRSHGHPGLAGAEACICPEGHEINVWGVTEVATGETIGYGSFDEDKCLHDLDVEAIFAELNTRHSRRRVANPRSASVVELIA